MRVGVTLTFAPKKKATPLVFLVCVLVQQFGVLFEEGIKRHKEEQHPATPYNTLQHPATPHNTLQHPATPCNALKHAHTARLAALCFFAASGAFCGSPSFS